MSREDRLLIRYGSLIAIAGSVIFMIANVLHPRSPDIESTPAQIETVAQSALWLSDHLALLLGGIMLLAGFIALKHLISSGTGSVWAKLGYPMAVVSTAVWTVLMAVDGIASKVVHDAWLVAPIAEKAMALRAAEIMEEIDISIFSAYIVVFFGVTFFLYACAVATSGVFPKWLGWIGALLAAAGFTVGMAQAYYGLSVLITNTLFASISSFLIIWFIAVCAISIRKARIG